MRGISIIICTYNGKARITDTLNCIINLESDFKRELIIVNNSSTDGTGEFCSQYLETHGGGIDWRIVQEERSGLVHARLRGFSESRYDYLLYCDDDNSLSKDYLTIGFSLMETHTGVGALGGQGFPIFEGEKPDWFDKYSHSYALGPQSGCDGKLKSPASLYGAGVFFRQKALAWFIQRNFKTVLTGRKGQSLMAGDDVEWCYLVQLAGYEIWYDHRLAFGHFMSSSRMRWDYYLKMKAGITSGAARLFPYTCLLRNRRMKFVSFFMRWLFNANKFTLVYMRQLLLNLPLKTITPQANLSLVILKARAASFWLDSVKCLKHFQYLKKFL
jgi:glycosyltransferase involved in cell wall biosynthesis